MKLKAKVVEGFQTGRLFGIPTANLEIKASDLDLKYGVYLVSVCVENQLFDGILHVGKRKTLDRFFSVEVHIFDFDKNIYNEEMEVEILKFVRKTEKFENIDQLFAQVNKDIVQAKKYFLRRKIYAQWEWLASQEKEYLAEKSLEKISQNTVFKNILDILIYAPQDNREIDFVQKLMKNFPEKSYFFPKVLNTKMEFFRVKNFKDLTPGAFDILEPKKNERWQQREKTLVFVPAVAVDKDGFRLGKGGGFYDQFLAQIKTKGDVFSICVLPKFSVLPEIPKEEHDERVGEVLMVK